MRLLRSLRRSPGTSWQRPEECRWLPAAWTCFAVTPDAPGCMTALTTHDPTPRHPTLPPGPQQPYTPPPAHLQPCQSIRMTGLMGPRSPELLVLSPVDIIVHTCIPRCRLCAYSYLFAACHLPRHHYRGLCAAWLGATNILCVSHGLLLSGDWSCRQLAVSAHIKWRCW